MFEAWDRNSGAVLAFGPSEQPRGVIDRLHWPPSHLVPSFVKPLTRRAVRVPNLPTPFNRLISAVIYPVVQVVTVATTPRRMRTDSAIRQCVHDVVGAPCLQFDLAVRRDASYLNWRYIEPPHVRYAIVALKRRARSTVMRCIAAMNRSAA